MMRTIWSLYGITIVVVATRLYAQWTSRKLDIVDALMVLLVVRSLKYCFILHYRVKVCGITLCSMLTIQHQYGLRRHFFFLSDHQRTMTGKFNFVGQALGVYSYAFILERVISI
jgi:hypothetical protein